MNRKIQSWVVGSIQPPGDTTKHLQTSQNHSSKTTPKPPQHSLNYSKQAALSDPTYQTYLTYSTKAPRWGPLVPAGLSPLWPCRPAAPPPAAEAQPPDGRSPPRGSNLELLGLQLGPVSCWGSFYTKALGRGPYFSKVLVESQLTKNQMFKSVVLESLKIRIPRSQKNV